MGPAALCIRLLVGARVGTRAATRRLQGESPAAQLNAGRRPGGLAVARLATALAGGLLNNRLRRRLAPRMLVRRAPASRPFPS